jgi:hypothetical protein
LKDKNNVKECFYRRHQQYANWHDRVFHNCLKCKRDKKNKECKYYIPVEDMQEVEIEETK